MCFREIHKRGEKQDRGSEGASQIGRERKLVREREKERAVGGGKGRRRHQRGDGLEDRKEDIHRLEHPMDASCYKTPSCLIELSVMLEIVYNCAVHFGSH